MKNKTTSVSTLYACIVLLSACNSNSGFKKKAGWYNSGDHPFNYEMGIDPGSGINGGDASSIRFIGEKAYGFGTFATESSVDAYKGKRVRMSGSLKSKDVSKWAGFWMRFNGDSGKVLSLDNMHDGETDRSIKGNTAWKRYSIVLDVPAESKQMFYGTLLVGKGQVWFDDVTFEIVDTTVAVTGVEYPERYSYKKQENSDSEHEFDFEDAFRKSKEPVLGARAN